MERKEYMLKLRQEGKSYAKIGKLVGLSKQRVFQLIGGIDKAQFRPYDSSQCVYDGLRNYLNENKISRTELIRMMYGQFHPELRNRLSGYLSGTEMRMSYINKILEATGLTYEQAFLFKENTTKEIFNRIESECVDSEGRFNYGAYLNLKCDMKGKE